MSEKAREGEGKNERVSEKRKEYLLSRNTHVRVATLRDALVRTDSGAEEKKAKMKNKTSIKYMRGPWRGGNLSFTRATEKKKSSEH